MAWEQFEHGWRLAPVDAPARALVVLLHGVGSNAQDLLPLADSWRTALPGVAFTSLDGSERFDGGFGGRQWFSLRDVNEAGILEGGRGSGSDRINRNDLGRVMSALMRGNNAWTAGEAGE